MANNPDGYNLMLLDEELQNIKAAYFPQKEFLSIDLYAPQFSCDEKGVPYFFFPTSNCIYKLTGTKAIPYIEVDFGDRTMPYEMIAELQDSKTYEELVADKKYLGYIGDFRINKENIYFSFRESGLNIAVNQYYCLYNTNTQTPFLYTNPFMEKCKYPFATAVKQITNNKHVFILQPSTFSESSIPVLKKELSEHFDLESNPCLCLLELEKSM
jgi:hypothetical protein